MDSREGLELIGSDLITPREIQLITGYDLVTARKEHEYIRKALGYGSEELLIKQFCEFNGLDFKEIVAFLNPYRFKPKWLAGEYFHSYTKPIRA